MYVRIHLKCPDEGEWLAVTRVNADGETESLGYLSPTTIPPVVATLKELHAKVEHEGHESWATVDAWEHFVHWAEVVAEIKSDAEGVTTT